MALTNDCKLQVLLPAYNAQEHIGQCLASLQSQTFTAFEVLILDDASTDATAEAIAPFLADSRFVLQRNRENIGIIPARNLLLDKASAELVAFMDADDICDPERLQRQYQYLTQHPDVAVVGSWYRLFGAKEQLIRPPTNALAVRAALAFDNMVCNPATMMRLAMVRAGQFHFDIAYRGSADYKFYYDIACHHPVVNLPLALLSYRIHDSQESTQNRTRQRLAHRRVVEGAWQALGLALDYDKMRPLIWPAEATQADLAGAGACARYIQQSLALPDKALAEATKSFIELRFKSLCKGFGLLGLRHYLGAYGLRQCLKGRRFGVSFAWDCLKQAFIKT